MVAVGSDDFVKKISQAQAMGVLKFAEGWSLPGRHYSCAPLTRIFLCWRPLKP